MSRSLILTYVACGFAAAAAIALHRNANHEHPLTPQAVYVCRETGELFLGQENTVPEIHPDTGRATLWPGLYCPECEKWTAGPPIERLYGHSELLDCPVCRTRRWFDGPLPEDAGEL